MDDSREYYKAYDDRYAQVHGEELRWFSEDPSPIVEDVIREYGISKEDRILEIGCGEGRDARYLLSQGYSLLATDVSVKAVEFCRKNMPGYADRFHVLDCITERLEEQFSFIYAVAVVHMLLLDEDRACFYQFIREQLSEKGVALICSMGDGITERKSDIATAFELQERTHEQTGRTLKIAGTSYRAVPFDTFEREIRENGLRILKTGLTDVKPDYYKMMYAVVRKG